MPNDALGVDHEDRGPARDLPLARNRTVAAAGPPRAPIEMMLHDGFAHGVAVGIAVDAEQGEGMILVFLDERPLVGIERPARRSPMPPEIEDDDLAAIIAETKLYAVHVFAYDVGRRLADARTGAARERRWFGRRQARRGLETPRKAQHEGEQGAEKRPHALSSQTLANHSER